MLFRFQYTVKLCSCISTWVEKNVAPLRLMGSPPVVRPMVPCPHVSIPSCSFKSKMPLRKVRQNLDRMVAVTSEWVGGTPSAVPFLGSLYQPWRVIHWTGARRALNVIQSTWLDGASSGT